MSLPSLGHRGQMIMTTVYHAPQLVQSNAAICTLIKEVKKRMRLHYAIHVGKTTKPYLGIVFPLCPRFHIKAIKVSVLVISENIAGG